MAEKKEKKRAYGDGGTTLRDDGRYEARIMLDGKRRSFYGDTEKEARQKMRQAQRLAEEGRLPDKEANQTLKKFLLHWYELKGGIADTTAKTYGYRIHNHIIPGLGHIQLKKLTAPKIQSFYQKLIRVNKLAPSTVQLVHSILDGALEDAVQWGYLPRNPCEHVKAPKSEERDFLLLEPEQVQALIGEVKGTKLEPIIILALTTALRKGEILALNWGDIDFDAKTVVVRRNLAYTPEKGRYVKEPKTKKGRRTIALTTIAIESLKQHRTRQIEERLKAKVWEQSDAIFTTRKGGYMWVATLHINWKQLLLRAGLSDIRFHDLRHNAASILLFLGVSEKMVQEILGHSSIRITMDIYGHIRPSMQRLAMDQMEKYMRDIQ